MMKNKIVIRQTSEDNYVSDEGTTVQREYGLLPNGLFASGKWVLRREGEFVDFDMYINDLTERHNLRIG
jgi:hypothetical protein